EVRRIVAAASTTRRGVGAMAHGAMIRIELAATRDGVRRRREWRRVELARGIRRLRWQLSGATHIEHQHAPVPWRKVVALSCASDAGGDVLHAIQLVGDRSGV